MIKNRVPSVLLKLCSLSKPLCNADVTTVPLRWKYCALLMVKKIHCKDWFVYSVGI